MLLFTLRSLLADEAILSVFTACFATSHLLQFMPRCQHVFSRCFADGAAAACGLPRR
jgi:hypothetical protein